MKIATQRGSHSRPGGSTVALLRRSRPSLVNTFSSSEDYLTPTPESKPGAKSESKPETRQGSAETTEPIGRSHFEFLSREHHEACVSIFLPTHSTFPGSKQDPIRLKDLIRQAESGLKDLGYRSVKVREILAPARELIEIEREGFWSAADGLAIFLSRGFFQYFRLPISFENLVTVTDRFEISPLLPLFTAGGRFYILALSRNHVRLIEGTPYGWAELDLPNVPRSEAEALKYDVRQSVLQVHSGAGGAARGKESEVFTGQGIGVDDEQTRTLEYVYAVERGVRRRLREQEPLLLAAVEELEAVYRKVNRHRGLLEHGVHGNPDRLSSGELHKAGREVARTYFDEEKRQTITTYTELRGAGRSSKDLHEILLGAHQGRVQSAFIETGIHVWGDFDCDCDALQLHDNQQPRDEDLLNVIAVQTILHKGSAYQLPRQDMPDESFVAATFRY